MIGSNRNMGKGREKEIMGVAGLDGDEGRTDLPTGSVRRPMWLLLCFVALLSVLAIALMTWSTYQEARRRTQYQLVSAVSQAAIPLEILLGDFGAHLNEIVLEEWEPAVLRRGRPNNVYFDRNGLPVGIIVPLAAYEPAIRIAIQTGMPALSMPFPRAEELRAIILEARRGRAGAIRGFVGVEFSVPALLDRWRSLRASPGAVLSLRNAGGGAWLRYSLGSHAIIAGPGRSLDGKLSTDDRATPGGDLEGETEPVKMAWIDVDGTMCLVAWRKVAVAGLTIAAIAEAGQVFANWRRNHLMPVLISLGVILAALGLIAWIATIVVRETRRREASISQLRIITDNLPVLIAYFDTNERCRFINATGANWCALPVSEVLGRSIQELNTAGDYLDFQPYVARTLSGQTETFERPVRFGDESERNVRVTFIPHIRGAGVVGFFGLAEDLTEQKKSEERLRHSEKMQAVGQLTGGIAHDFNNLLTVILGNLELLTNGLHGSDSNMKRFAAAALRAAERGGKLTHRLLVFARKQPLRPVSVDLNAIIDEMEILFGRTLGETVSVAMKKGDALWPCAADPSQLENMILNLAINARDAMPDGGTITIETGNVEIDRIAAAEDGIQPGQYVMVSVADTGTGIPPDVIEKVFDPFFTTKASGQGTGLGLSMAYGFVTQSGGNIRIESKVGEGTTMRVYLPRATDKTREVLAPNEVEIRQMPAGPKTILVVDDDDMVRSTATSMVSGLGYRTLEAADGQSAIAALKANPDIKLLFTDIVMAGGLNGFQLAEEAQKLDPNIKILFTTGYSENYDALAKSAFRGSTLLTKPYQKQELARELRQVLDAVQP